MISEQRVRLMTKMAVYEKNEGGRDARINTQFLADYLGFRMVGSFIYVTIACVLGVAVYGAYNFEGLMLKIYSMDLKDVLLKGARWYILVLIVFEAITFLVYFYRYNRMRNNLESYYADLKSLNEIYKAERNL